MNLKYLIPETPDSIIEGNEEINLQSSLRPQIFKAFTKATNLITVKPIKIG